MKLDNYIHNLLIENETVIVPGFGAFFSEYKPAEISETEIKPPSKQISFSSNIRNNDGLLVGHVATAEQISHFDALKLIEKERDNIIFLLDKGEEVSLEEIGRLTINDQNEIVFSPYQVENLSMENFGLEAVSLEKLNEIQSEPEVEEVPTIPTKHIPETIEENAPVEKEKQTLPEEIIDVPTVENDISEEPETQPEVIEEQQSSVVEQEEIPENETLEPVVEPVFVTLEEEELKEEEKKKAGWYWYLLILVPIIIAGIFVVRNASDSKPEVTDSKQIDFEQTPQPEIQTESQPIISEDSIEVAQENIIKQDSTASITSEEIAEFDTITGRLMFYLIGGSFKESEENALAYMEELKDKGFEPFYMGKQGNFYTVAIGKYNTEGQAVRARDTIWMKYPDWQIWVKEE